ncbi:MAG: BON domain-containing protein [Steroidobacteraceae bacterium]
MKSDRQVRDDIEAELDWDTRFDSRNIGVAVKDGVVTLSGHVSAYPDRLAVQRATESTAGVKAIANEIEIKLPIDNHRSDTEIAASALMILEAQLHVPAEDVQLTVNEGWITLNGNVKFWHQKNAVESAICHLRGVRGVDNNIKIKTDPMKISGEEVRDKIENAFQRHAHCDAEKIRVVIADGIVTLEGEVPTLRERESAVVATWNAPGVFIVNDHLIVTK